MAKRDEAIRKEACRCAAIAVAGRPVEANFGPVVWSLAVFFEMYMRDGANGTRKEFGPKRPRKLKAV